MVALLPMTCAATMVTASHWVGFTLPGMIEEPGSFSGRRSSPKPERGPEPKQPNVVGDLEQRHGDRVERAVGEHIGVVARERLELVRRGDEGQLGHLGDLAGEQLGKLRDGR